MIFFVIGILILIYGFVNFKRSFLFFLVFKLFLNGNITVIAIPELPTLTLELMMTMYYAVMFLLQSGKYKSAKTDFDFTIPFILLSISWIISSFFAVIGFGNVYTKVISTIFNEVIMIYMIWQMVETKEDFNFIFKWFTIVFFASCVYGLVEAFLQANPLINYEQAIIQDASRIRDFTYSSTTIRGYRISSFFEHSMGAAVNWGMYAVWILTAMVQYKWRIKPKYIALVTVILCIPCIYLGKSRSAILFVAIGCLAFVNFRRKLFYYITFSVAIAVTVVLPFLGENLTLITSLFDQSAQNVVGGSNISMRLSQLEACFMLLKEHPIVGWGYGFTSSITNAIIAWQIRGLESIWFVTMTCYGIIGMIAEAVLAYFSIVKIPKKYKSTSIFFFCLAYWLTYTVTTFPGIQTHMYYLIIFYMIKQSDVYKNADSLITKKTRIRFNV